MTVTKYVFTIQHLIIRAISCSKRGKKFEPVYESFVFVRIALNAVKLNNSPRFTVFNEKVVRNTR